MLQCVMAQYLIIVTVYNDQSGTNRSYISRNCPKNVLINKNEEIIENIA